VLGELKELGLEDNTIVIYASDHGDFVAGHGMVAKCAVGHNVYEDTLRVPLMLRWPGRFQAGTARSDLVSLIDLCPTVLALTGATFPAGARKLGGLDLAPALLEGKAIERQYVVSENWSQITVIGKRYKLGVWQDPGRRYAQWDLRGKNGDMLFDLQADPLETRNLAGKPEVAQEEKRMRDFLGKWLKETDATGRIQVGKRPAMSKPPRNAKGNRGA